jgi:spore cortex formation protein SpoVR/YcgB (stage V sporulation)
MVRPLYTGSEWNFEMLEDVYNACETIAFEDLKLNIYQNQLEVISSEQMLDAYSSSGLPIYYKHWSFGKHFSSEEQNYRKGYTGLAYEIVINSNPCINYLMEENTITTQTTVIAHAAFGHNHFFKNNYLFRQWTDASHIMDYLIFAKNYLYDCEQRYGADIVEKLLDSCHALSRHGISRYKRPVKLNFFEETQRKEERDEYLKSIYNDLWRTLPKTKKQEKKKHDVAFSDPEENILYFIEKNSPILELWQREVVRIVRKISQYFYPQYQTKVMNEGWAVFSHFFIMNRLYDKGLLTDGAMLEFIHTHSGVLYQPSFDNQRYNGFNPYYLGFEMFRDIKRICDNPTAEDKEWFPDFAGSNWLETCLYAVENYRDESFIRQFLSPTLIRKMKLFVLNNNSDKDHYRVEHIHNRQGYKNVRTSLASQYEIGNMLPDIQVYDANFKGDRMLMLHHNVQSGKLLSKETDDVLKHVKRLWGYQVKLESRQNGLLIKAFSTDAEPQLKIE